MQPAAFIGAPSISATCNACFLQLQHKRPTEARLTSKQQSKLTVTNASTLPRLQALNQIRHFSQCPKRSLVPTAPCTCNKYARNNCFSHSNTPYLCTKPNGCGIGTKNIHPHIHTPPLLMTPCGYDTIEDGSRFHHRQGPQAHINCSRNANRALLSHISNSSAGRMTLCRCTISLACHAQQKKVIQTRCSHIRPAHET